MDKGFKAGGMVTGPLPRLDTFNAAREDLCKAFREIGVQIFISCNIAGAVKGLNDLSRYLDEHFSNPSTRHNDRLADEFYNTIYERGGD